MFTSRIDAMSREFSTLSTSYAIRIATPNDLPCVLKVMRHSFHFEETIFYALCSRAKITQDERKMIETILDNSVKEAFNSSPCLVAIHNESNKIVGVNIMTLSKNPKFNDISDGHSNFFTSKTKSVLVNRYFQYLYEFNDKANLFVQYPDATTILEFYAIAVDENHRKMGISKNLINAGIILAQGIEEISLVFGVFTSTYSMRSAMNTGMQVLLKINLLDYKDNEGKFIFENTKPHNIVFIMTKQIR